jgi:hypothetical protein
VFWLGLGCIGRLLDWAVGQTVGVAGFDNGDVDVSRSTIAAQSLGSVKVLVQSEKDSLLEMAMEFFS